MKELDDERAQLLRWALKDFLNNFSFAEKSLSLEALDVKTWLNGVKISSKGAVPVNEEIVSNSPYWVT